MTRYADTAGNQTIESLAAVAKLVRVFYDDPETPFMTALLENIQGLVVAG